MLNRLDHYTIRTDKLAATRDFYADVLGLIDGDRPNFDFPGNWLYIGDQPVVHLVGTAGAMSTAADSAGSGSIDHVAFRAEGRDRLKAHLDARNINYRQRQVPGMDLHQFFIEDPNGITVEINCFS